MIHTIPAHTFEATVGDPRCGYHHRIDDETCAFCAFAKDNPVHAGQDTTIRLHDWADEEDES